MRFLRSSPQRDEVPPWPHATEIVRILVVDDDEDDFALLRSTFNSVRGTRFELDWADSYDVGLSRILERAHHAYLIDYRLGGSSGVDLVREARAGGSVEPLIMLTGERSRSVDIEAMDAGATDFLEKGRTPPDLLERTIRYAIAHNATTQALRRALAQVSAIEAFGRLLSHHGPAPDVLDEVIRLLIEEFGATQASLYLMERDELRLAASHGHAAPAGFIDPTAGRLRRVIDSGRAQTIPNVTTDPEHRAGNEPIEQVIPLLGEGAVLGILNVTWPGDVAGEAADQGARIVADRLGVGLALNRAVRGRSFVGSRPPSGG